MKIRSRLLNKIGAFLGVWSFRLLFATCRKKFVGEVLEERFRQNFDQSLAPQYILCVWHDQLLLPTFSAPKPLRKQICCLVSKHRDGSLLADAMYWMDYSTVRGSSKHGGVEALRQLVTDTKGKHIIFTPDGPQGPRRTMKQGAIFVASQTGRPILPGAFVARHCWRIPGRWTDLVIPVPFTTIYLVSGAPIPVPPNLEREQISVYVNQAQRVIDELNDKADALYAARPGIKFKPKSKAA